METDEYMCPLSLFFVWKAVLVAVCCVYVHVQTSKIHYIRSIATLRPDVVEGLEFSVGLLSCTACQ